MTDVIKNEKDYLFMSLRLCVPRAGKSAGTWEPSSQKEIYLKENFRD